MKGVVGISWYHANGTSACIARINNLAIHSRESIQARTSISVVRVSQEECTFLALLREPFESLTSSVSLPLSVNRSQCQHDVLQTEGHLPRLATQSPMRSYPWLSSHCASLPLLSLLLYHSTSSDPAAINRSLLLSCVPVTSGTARKPGF